MHCRDDVVHLESSLFELMRKAYVLDADFQGFVEVLSASSETVKLTKRHQAHLYRYRLSDELLTNSVNWGIINAWSSLTTRIYVTESFMRRTIHRIAKTCDARRRTRLWHAISGGLTCISGFPVLCQNVRNLSTSKAAAVLESTTTEFACFSRLLTLSKHEFHL